jgi:ABC-type branched-subunit amino acid transport system substrate-binding protein
LSLSRREVLRLGAAGVALAASASVAGCSILMARSAPPDLIQVGAIGLFPSDRRRYKGELPEDALRAAVGRLNALGGILGKQVAYRGAHAGTEDEAVEGLRRLASDPSVVGIVLTTPLAAETIADEAARAGMPLISTGYDFLRRGGLPPRDPSRQTIYQFAIPTSWALDLLAKYCAKDRKFKRVGIVYDEVQFQGVVEEARAACARWGLEIVFAEPAKSDLDDLRAQLETARASACHAFFAWVDAKTLADTSKLLYRMDASYVDVDSARSPSKGTWRPQLMGAPEAMVERDWATEAGEAARPGSITVGDVGAFRKGPEWLPEIWGRDHVLGWERVAGARRGIRGVVDACYALLEAARRAGRADREAVAQELENGGIFQFCSTKFELSSTKRVALTEGDLCLMALERDTPRITDPPYELGREWKDETAVAPDMTVLWRPTLEANLAKAPEWVGPLVEAGYGLQCTRSGSSLTPACKIH